MVSPIDPRFLGDPMDWLAFQQLQSGTPDIFQITLSAITQAVVFRVGTTNVGRARRQVSGYNIHFLPLALASPSILYNIDGALSAFQISDIILSTGAPGPGGVVTASSTSQWNRAGYYFAAPVNQAGQESQYFAGPKLAPLPGNIASAQTPPDVSDPTLVVTTETLRGRSVRKLQFSARVPSNGNGVIAVFITNMGTGLTPGQRVDIVFAGGGGSGAKATGIANDLGGLGEVVITETGAGYTTVPTATPSVGTASLEAQVGPAAAFMGFQIYIDHYFNNSLQEAQFISGPTYFQPGQLMSGSMYLLPDTPPTGMDIDFYFVSISTTGSRRVDPTAAPVYTLVGGLT